MTTRNEIKKVIAYLSMAYPNYHPDISSPINSVDVFFDLLGDLPKETLEMAVRSCCAEPGRAFAPSAGEIRGMAVSLQVKASGTPTAGEAWAAIIESFQHTSFHQPALLKHSVVAEAVRQMGGLALIGFSENIMAERAHFLKIYASLIEHETENAAMLPDAVQYIQAQKQIGAGIMMLTDRLAVKL